MSIDDDIDRLDDQILCPNCEEHALRAVRAQSATVLDQPVSDFVPPDCNVVLLCPGCQYIEDGDERL